MTVVLERPSAEPSLADPPPRRIGRLGRLVRGRPADPAWVRPALLVLLSGTAVAYLWALGDSGWANSFYSAAVQAGTKSWKAFFFGSSDASNFITVDKPPASLWLMEISARLFGVNSWSILVPQALEGVASVGLLYATVRRWFRPGAALMAGAVLATTPVAALMFRYNNPDALLTLLLVLAAYATVRALERGSTAWLVLAASAVGTGFITKMLQAFLVVPALALVFLVAAPPPFLQRIRRLLVAGVALVVSAGWWVAVVQLTPAADRPYIGGSANNSLLNLIFGYNGFGRLSGNEAGSIGGAGPAGSRWGPVGWDRLFLASMGGQISWLLPAALVFLAATLWLSRRHARTDRTRAAIVLFGGWLLVTGAVFSFAQGIIHPYYTVVLAPAIGALVGIGCSLLWHRRHERTSRLALALALALTAVWAFVLLDRTPAWLPPLRWLVLVVGLLSAAALALAPRLRGRVALALGVAGMVAALGGPAAYAIDTVGTSYNGAIPGAGPTVPGLGPGGGFPGGFAPPGLGAFRPGAGFGRGVRPPGIVGRPFPPGAPGTAIGGFAPGGRFPGGGGATTGRGPFAGGAGRVGGGGFLSASRPGTQVTALLEAGASHFKWVAATVNSNNAAGYQLATDDPVMAIGGFNGTDPAPTLAAFKADVAAGQIHYFIAGGGFAGFAPTTLGGGGTTSASSAVTSWVESHFSSKTVDGVLLYDLTATPRNA
ncbi:MAG TPA: glycosyltransferase family 39 protein [Acidimicrobiales bacterium]|nr:glycosyltransferase family 39 protein [Acidimicrobiales bacterium]